MGSRLSSLSHDSNSKTVTGGMLTTSAAEHSRCTRHAEHARRTSYGDETGDESAKHDIQSPWSDGLTDDPQSTHGTVAFVPASRSVSRAKAGW